MVAGGDHFDYWHFYCEGFANGTDPQHPEYWGEVRDMDQRHVEATAVGLALLVVPNHIWQPLDDRSKANVAAWLLQSRDGDHALNNHMFFRVFVDLGLKSVGVLLDEPMTEDYLVSLENLYLSDGWYREGASKGDDRRVDYYNAFAMHYYGLLYAKHHPQDLRRASLFRGRARLFAQQFRYWFADTGATCHSVGVSFIATALLHSGELLHWSMKRLYHGV